MQLHTAYLDSKHSDDVRRKNLWNGQIYLFSARSSTLAFINHARGMIEEAFGKIDPRFAQFEMPVEKYVEIVAPLKPRFMHHPKTRELIRGMMDDFRCDLQKTYIDVPRLRMVTSHGYLTSGVGYAHHPHRDTWYSAPMCQMNWWVPIYDIESEMSMAFHPQYWDRPIKNGSSDFNYYEWNATGRKEAAKQIKTDTRKQPKPLEEIEMWPQIRFIPPPGGIILFAAAQLHSAIANTEGFARYSIDFRTVHLDDVMSSGGAPNLDTKCTGTSLRDFVRASDYAAMPAEAVALYDTAPKPDDAKLIFHSQPAGA